MEEERRIEDNGWRMNCYWKMEMEEGRGRLVAGRKRGSKARRLGIDGGEKEDER